jgi:hypothetical protein
MSRMAGKILCKGCNLFINDNVLLLLLYVCILYDSDVVSEALLAALAAVVAPESSESLSISYVVLSC